MLCESVSRDFSVLMLVVFQFMCSIGRPYYHFGTALAGGFLEFGFIGSANALLESWIILRIVFWGFTGVLVAFGFFGVTWFLRGC